MKKGLFFGSLVLSFWGIGVGHTDSSPAELVACAKLVGDGFRLIAEHRDDRFLGKVQEGTALCRGGPKATKFLATPWVDWSMYWGAGDESSRADGPEALTLTGEHLKPNG